MQQAKVVSGQEFNALPKQIRDLLLEGKQVKEAAVTFSAPKNATPEQLQQYYDAHMKAHPDAMQQPGRILQADMDMYKVHKVLSDGPTPPIVTDEVKMERAQTLAARELGAKIAQAKGGELKLDVDLKQDWKVIEDQLFQDIKQQAHCDSDQALSLLSKLKPQIYEKWKEQRGQSPQQALQNFVSNLRDVQGQMGAGIQCTPERTGTVATHKRNERRRRKKKETKEPKEKFQPEFCTGYCKAMSDKIDLVCDYCLRHYCKECWTEANDQYFGHPLNDDGLYHAKVCDACDMYSRGEEKERQTAEKQKQIILSIKLKKGICDRPHRRTDFRGEVNTIAAVCDTCHHQICLSCWDVDVECEETTGKIESDGLWHMKCCYKCFQEQCMEEKKQKDAEEKAQRDKETAHLPKWVKVPDGWQLKQPCDILSTDIVRLNLHDEE